MATEPNDAKNKATQERLRRGQKVTKRRSKPNTTADNTVESILSCKEKKCFAMVAGAGSGKTTSLVKALNFICERFGLELAQNDQQIACITYTEIAVDEIKSDTSDTPLIHVSTIHSFLWSVVKPFQKDISRWVAFRIQEEIDELKEKMRNYGPRTHNTTKEKDSLKLQKLEKQLPLVLKVKKFTYESGRNYPKGILGHDDIIKMVPKLISEKPLLRKIVAQKYPFFFIDESQDTVQAFIESLFLIENDSRGRFCLGLFGDPMQKIYATGIGKIDLPEHWHVVSKPENFRCSPAVLSVVNSIRKGGDPLVQISGLSSNSETKVDASSNEAFFFIFPADHNKDQNLSLVKNWLATKTSDAKWNDESESNETRILVLVHGMAAKRLGFSNLHSAFYDNGTDSLKSRFIEGTSWQLKPLLDTILPLSDAFSKNRRFEVITILRKNSPLFLSANENTNMAEMLASLKASTTELRDLVKKGESSICDILRFAKKAKIIELDERFDQFLESQAQSSSTISLNVGSQGIEVESEDMSEDEKAKNEIATRAFLQCRISEVTGYRMYQEDLSPYSTQQGIKGAEFDRVLVVLDEEEGKHIQFSYEKLFGLKSLSDTDQKNIAEGKDSVVDRTRRLFYVCCSRAKRTLGVVLFTEDPQKSAEIIKSRNLFHSSRVYTLEELNKNDN